MKHEEKKKGLLGGLFGSKKEKNSCCQIELEELTEMSSGEASDSDGTDERLTITESQESPMDLANNASGCSCGSSCCDISADTKDEQKRIVIDLLYLDLSVCSRCQGTDTSLDDALADVASVMETTGVEVLVNKVHVLSEEQAREYQFVSSPTIRVNGRDIQMEVKESFCESCGDLCGEDVDCRVWVYQGREYTVPPQAMITEAILKEAYGSSDRKEERQEYHMPENLKRFYQTMRKKNGEISEGCC